MTISRVLPPAVTPVVEEKQNLTQADNVNPGISRNPAPNGPASVPPRAQRANFLAKGAKTGSLQKAPPVSARESTGTTWNKGAALACELLQALMSSHDGTDGN